jgi:hypothetical protein
MIYRERILCHIVRVDTELIARQRVGMMLDKISESDQRPDVITLTDYENEACFNFLLPDAGWTFSEWQAVNEKVARQLQKDHKLKVSRVPVKLHEYFDFLARYHLTNTPGNRAQFVAWRTAPEPKPEPQRD